MNLHLVSNVFQINVWIKITNKDFISDTNVYMFPKKCKQITSQYPINYITNKQTPSLLALCGSIWHLLVSYIPLCPHHPLLPPMSPIRDAIASYQKVPDSV